MEPSDLVQILVGINDTLDAMQTAGETVSANVMRLVLSGYAALVIGMGVAIKYISKTVTHQQTLLEAKDEAIAKLHKEYNEATRVSDDRLHAALGECREVINTAGNAFGNLSTNIAGLTTEVRNAMVFYREYLDRSLHKLDTEIRDLTRKQ